MGNNVDNLEFDNGRCGARLGPIGVRILVEFSGFFSFTFIKVGIHAMEI